MVAVVAAAVVGAGALGYSAYQSSKARKEQKRANARAERLDQIRSQRERAEALRSNRIQAAEITAMGAAANLQGSTAVQGSLAALFSNEASNLNFANVADELNRQRMQYLSRADSYAGRASLGEVVAGIAASVPRIGG